MPQECGPVDLSAVLARLGAIEAKLNRIEGEARAIRSALQTMQSLIQSIPALIAANTREIQATLRAAVAELSSIMRLGLSEIQATLRTIVTQLGAIIRNAVSEIAATIRAFIAFLTALLGQNNCLTYEQARSLHAQTHSIIQSAKSSVIEEVRALATALSNRANEILSRIDALKIAISDEIEALQIAIRNKIQEVLTRLDSVMRSLTETIQMQIALVLNRINQVIELLANLRRDEPVDLSSVISAVRQEGQRTRDAVFGVRPLLIAIQASVNSLRNQFSAITEQIRASETAIRNKVDEIASKLSAVRQALLNEIQAQGTAIKNKVDEVKSQINDLFRTIRDFIGYLDTKLDWVLEAISGIPAQVLSQLQQYLRSLESKINQVLAAVRGLPEAINQLGNQLDARLNRILNTVRNTRSDVLNSLFGIRPLLLRILQLLQARSQEPEEPNENPLISKIYRILGGDAWYNDEGNLSYQINPELTIKGFRSAVYENDQSASRQITVTTLPGLLSSLSSIAYHRSGFHRFPAQVPASLTREYASDDAEQDAQISLYDAASWQEWLIKQLDELHGAYPIKIKYKDSEGEEKTFKLSNAAETQAEMMGLLLSIAADTDILQAMSMKGIVESVGARVAAITAADYASANAEFLGYRGKESSRNLKISIKPGATNLKDALSESTKKITKWEFDDREDLQGFLKRLLLGVEIIKAVFYKDYDPGDQLPGERIREDRDSNGQNDDQEWADFLAELENPPPNRRDPNSPIPNIRNLADDEPPA